MRRADDAHKLNDDKEEERRLTVAMAWLGLQACAVVASNMREETQERRIVISSASSAEQQQPQPQKVRVY